MEVEFFVEFVEGEVRVEGKDVLNFSRCMLGLKTANELLDYEQLVLQLVRYDSDFCFVLRDENGDHSSVVKLE